MNRVVFAVFAIIAAAAQAADYDLTWIGKLPGVNGTVRRSAPGEFKAVYSVNADVDETLKKVQDGLTQRGWKVEAPTAVTIPGGVAVRALEADQGSAHVKVAITGAAGAVNLDVNMEGAPASGHEAKSAASASGEVAETHGDIDIAQGHVKKTFKCTGSAVNIRAGECRITLQGDCTSLNVQSGKNTVKIEGTIGVINVMGGHNTVTWSNEKNPTAPTANVMGADNQVHGE